MPKRIAIATCKVLPEPDVDQDLMLNAFRDAGFDCELLAWDDPSQDPADFDAVVVRSTWNYHLHYEDFVKWLKRTSEATKLFNPLSVMLDNLHKRYLLQLTENGVPTVPTQLIEPGESHTFSGDRSVIKPAIGASSWLTKIFRKGEDVQSHIDEIHKHCAALVQPYIQSVEQGGERSLVWIDGEFTHKIVKQPRFSEDEESVSQAEELTENERAIGTIAIERYLDLIEDKSPLLYARVDVMDDDEGNTLVSELELVEPSLFFLQDPSALDRLVATVSSA